MRTSIFMGERGNLAETVQEIVDLEAAGVERAWLWNIFGLDAMVVAAVAAARTTRISLGTAVIPTWPRHPYAMMQEALSVQAACEGRFTLGIGTSHIPVMSGMLGVRFERPIHHIREYVTVCRQLAAGSASFAGDSYNVHAPLSVEAATGSLDVMISALNPQMLRLGGEVADGVITWLANAEYTRDVVIPAVTEGAERAGRPTPPVITNLPVAVTDDVEGAKAAATAEFSIYPGLPFYRRMLDASSADGPADVALIGSEAAVAEGVAELAAAGSAELAAWPFCVGDSAGSRERTLDCLAKAAGLTDKAKEEK